MNVEIHPEKIRANHELVLLMIDGIMLALITFNLSWILFDAFFATALVQEWLGSMMPVFTQWYKADIHPNFAVYDMIFVSIYLFELAIRWMMAIIHKTHHRWFFYPFIHWYDVLGCIPIGSFRWLRLLRVVSIVSRLQRHGVINISDSYLFRVLRKYYAILVEEVSDRVVVNVLNGVQDEIKTGAPVADQILNDVVLPRRELLAKWLSGRINVALESAYAPNKRALHRYLNAVIAEAIDKDNKVSALHHIPVVGSPVAEAVEEMVGEIVYRIVDRLVGDIVHEDSDEIILQISDNLLEKALEPSDEFSEAAHQIVLDAIDVIKESVSEKQWKLKEDW